MCMHWPRVYTWLCDNCHISMGPWWMSSYYCLNIAGARFPFPMHELRTPRNSHCATGFPLCPPDWIKPDIEDAVFLGPDSTMKRPGPSICDACETTREEEERQRQEEEHERRVAEVFREAASFRESRQQYQTHQSHANQYPARRGRMATPEEIASYHQQLTDYGQTYADLWWLLEP
jgi:hypothetical protein